jgi:uncharacterized lipoprotein YajG
MKTPALLSLVAAVLFAGCAASMLLSAGHSNTATQAAATVAPATKIVDLGTVVVRPDPALMAELRREQQHITQLATITVRPDAALLAELRAEQQRIAANGAPLALLQ